MLNLSSESRIYLCTGCTDMCKGINGLSILAQSILLNHFHKSILFVFRGKQADKIKILWWDGQGFCLYYKCLESGKFTWPKVDEKQSISITKAQLSMLIEGIDWRNPRWSNRPEYIG